MKHLINAALKYEDFPDELLPNGDGIECLTDFKPFVPSKNRKVVSAHLPFCTDWYGIWSGKRPYLKGFDDSVQNYITYGRSREEIIDNLSEAISSASEINPEYAILHASSANVDELFNLEYSETSEEILLAFCDIMNAVNDRLGGMPVKLMFENQWWPGLRYLDEKEYWTIEDNLDFKGWGYCLDTGHLLVTSRLAGREKNPTGLLKDLILDIPEEVVKKIEVVHLHVNDSYEYIRNYDRKSANEITELGDRMRKGYEYVVGMDQHRPFTDKGCTDIINAIGPRFVVHEMGAADVDKKTADYRTQRSLFAF